MNILSIDLEPWYSDLPTNRWAQLPDNVVENVNIILNILSETNNKATFFTLTDIVNNHPELVRRIHREGHEIGSHGTAHVPLRELDPDEFEHGIIQSLDSLNELGIDAVSGYRAPYFSLDQSTSWALDILEDRGFRYDSSIFPVKTQLYGVPDAPRRPYNITSKDVTHRSDSGLSEIPLSTYRLPVANRNVPIAGGFYLRALPYPVFKRLLNSAVQNTGPAVCYLHPWELDPNIPRVGEYKWYDYFGISSTQQKFTKLLHDFEFDTTSQWLDNQSDQR